MLDARGKVKGSKSVKVLVFSRLVSRLILENMNPSESYNMTLTLKGEGVNYKTRVKTFQAHLYPSDVVVSNIQAQTHQLKMFYETQGLFSVSINHMDQKTTMYRWDKCHRRDIAMMQSGQRFPFDKNIHQIRNDTKSSNLVY